ncbi:YbhB/YbcL family Raf kinase inhibitor-like protein [Photobacterium leiognathi]|uniref:YbhB/YbcL family Raf kinase inhibitor-like protein n=1 Tax=Photobacterium leiognathi TaxID=553611 RepID=UPI003AF3D983
MKIKQVVAAVLLAAPAFMSHAAMTLTSQDITNDYTLQNQQLFNQWGCTGSNVSPQLSWKGVPEGTKSFAVTMYDPDAPTGSGWWHWSVVNIPANVHSLAAGAGAVGGKDLPKGASMVTNDFGFKGFGGACPPPNSKPHNYEITVYALNTASIKLPENASPALAGYNILSHVIGKAQLIAPTNAR